MATNDTGALAARRSIPYRPESVLPYVTMIEAFLSGQMAVGEFETAYLRAYKDDPTLWPEPVYDPLNEVFLDLDAYYPDPALRNEYDIDETELRVRTERSLAALRQAL